MTPSPPKYTATPQALRAFAMDTFASGLHLGMFAFRDGPGAYINLILFCMHTAFALDLISTGKK